MLSEKQKGGSMNSLNNTREQWEQWEQREQVNPSNDYGCSQADNKLENNENKLLTKIEVPLDAPPNKAQTPKIKRPCYMTHCDWVEVNGKQLNPGLYFHDENGGTTVDEYICSPLMVIAITSSTDDDDFGKLLRFIDSNGQWHEWAMPMRLLKSNGDELRGELLHQGATFNPKKRPLLIDFLMNAKPKRRVTAANRVGWHGSTYVLPDQVIGQDDVVFQSEIAGESDFSTLGSLEGWQQDIGRLCAGNTALMVSVSAALAGTLLKSLNRQQGGGVHWVGDSSTGKSTVAEISASMWGPPEFIRSWNTTANGCEGIAAQRNDNCLILDEINEASPYEVGKITYMVVNGQGKQRAGCAGNARKIHRWRTITISTGEKTLESIMKEVNQRINSGQAVRLLNIPTNFKYGAFDNLHEFSDGRSLSDHLKTARLNNYGHAGIAFIKKLIDENRKLPDLLNEETKKFLEITTENLEKRAASFFAIIALAGELGIEYGILPWKKGSASNAALIAFKRWQAFQGPAQTEDQKILQAIDSFINRYADSRFSDINGAVLNRAGWYKNVEGKRIFMFTGDGLDEAGGGYDRKRIVESLLRHKLLVDKDDDRFTKKTRINSTTVNLYYVRQKEDEDETGSIEKIVLV